MLGKLFSHSKRETQETDIVLTLTPRIVRVLDLNEADVRAFKVQREGEGAGGPIELPIPAALPPAAPAPGPATPPAPAAPPAGGGQAAPILPPAPAPPPPR